MVNQLRPALVMTALFTLLLGLAYPLAVTGIAQVAFPDQANGSLVRDAGGKVVGSSLIGQPFVGATYLHPRPSVSPRPRAEPRPRSHRWRLWQRDAPARARGHETAAPSERVPRATI